MIPHHTPNVAIIVAITNHYGREVLRGVAQYLHTYGPWNVHCDYEFSRWNFPRWLKTWRGNGIISRLACQEIATFSKQRRIPVVDLNEQNLSLGFPYVYNDQEHVGRMAAEHLMERGFIHFAYIGQQGLLWSDQRLNGFRQTVETASYICQEFVGKPVDEKTGVYRTNIWETENNKIRNWLLSLPKPIGIMACNSFRGLQITEVCQSIGIAIPESVALISGDDEEVVCELAVPSLTAVRLNGKSIGYLAASLLDRAMRGENISNTAVLIPPSEVVVRNSSQITAVTDDLLGKALQFIRENARFNIGVQDVAIHTGVSVRKIQLLFRNKLNCTVHNRIITFKLDAAIKLLRGSDLTLETIAYESGFNHVQRMSDIFLEKMGMRPGEFRRINQ